MPNINSIYPPAIHKIFAWESHDRHRGCAPDKTPVPGPIKLGPDGKPARGPDGKVLPRARRPLTPGVLFTARMKHLNERSEANWVALVNAIPDENLRRQIAKKVWWDFFADADRKWKGLDHLIYEDATVPRPVIKYVQPDTEVAFDDIRITLWRLGYTVQQIASQYPRVRDGWTYVQSKDD